MHTLFIGREGWTWISGKISVALVNLAKIATYSTHDQSVHLKRNYGNPSYTPVCLCPAG